MSKEEWVTRYAARMKTRADLTDADALAAALAAVECIEQETCAGADPEWVDPEDAADEELACWTDDGA